MTALSALGLTVIMIDATLSTLAIGAGALALMPGVLGVLVAGVAYGRRSLLTIPRRDALTAAPA